MRGGEGRVRAMYGRRGLGMTIIRLPIATLANTCTLEQPIRDNQGAYCWQIVDRV